MADRNILKVGEGRVEKGTGGPLGTWGTATLPFRSKPGRLSGRVISVESHNRRRGRKTRVARPPQRCLEIECHSRIRSTSLSVISSLVRS